MFCRDSLTSQIIRDVPKSYYQILTDIASSHLKGEIPTGWVTKPNLRAQKWQTVDRSIDLETDYSGAEHPELEIEEPDDVDQDELVERIDRRAV